MKIECTKEKLANAVSLAEKMTAKSATLPILKCLLLEAGKNTLIIKATNLDLGIEVKISVKTDETGVVAVPGNVLSSFLSNIPADKNVILETKEGNLKVSTKNNQTLIKAYSSEDFPSIPKIENGQKLTLNTKDLASGFKAVWYSSSVSSMKPELSSVFVYPDNDTLIFAATDSFRLAEKKVRVKQKKEFDQILVPFRNIPEIIKVLERENGEINISLNKNQISFDTEDVHLVSRVVDGLFPDYKQIIPKESKTEAVVLKQDLISSMKLANIFSDNFNQISLKISPKGKVFELSTRNGEVGENQNKLDAAVSGEDVEISFNYRYINDCFQSIDADSLSLQFNGANKPMLIKGVNDKSFLYLVSPMNK